MKDSPKARAWRTLPPSDDAREQWRVFLQRDDERHQALSPTLPLTGRYNSGSGFAPFWTLRLALLGGAPWATFLGISHHPYMRLFCSRRARPASGAIASTLSFSHKPLCRQRSLTTSLRSTSPSRTAMRRTHRECPGHRSASLSITSYNFVLHRQRSLITLLRTLTRLALLCGVPIAVPWASERRPLYHQL